jgi:hypothetical protein
VSLLLLFLIGLRSGTARVFNNIKSGAGTLTGGVSMASFRDGYSFMIWAACNGNGPYDLNTGTTYATGTITATSLSGTTLSVTDSSKTWTANQWVANPPYSVIDTTLNPLVGGAITSSAATSVTSSVYGSWMSEPPFAVGHTYNIKQATACIDQVGRGQSSVYLSGNTGPDGGPVGPGGTPVWPSDALDPVYEWADQSDNTPTFGWVKNSTGTARFVENVDYYQQKSPFTGASGTGFGLRGSRPATCTNGVAYWSVDQGSWNPTSAGPPINVGGTNYYNGVLDKCTDGANANPALRWTNDVYHPYNYPHPQTIQTTSCNNTNIGNGITCVFSKNSQSTDGGLSVSTGTFTSSGNLEIIVLHFGPLGGGSNPCIPVDNKNTTLVPIDQMDTTISGPVSTKVWYVTNPTVGTGHQITCTSSVAIYPGLDVLFFSTPSPFFRDVYSKLG